MYRQQANRFCPLCLCLILMNSNSHNIYQKMPGSNVTWQLISQVLHGRPQSHRANATTAAQLGYKQIFIILSSLSFNNHPLLDATQSNIPTTSYSNSYMARQHQYLCNCKQHFASVTITNGGGTPQVPPPTQLSDVLKWTTVTVYTSWTIQISETASSTINATQAFKIVLSLWVFFRILKHTNKHLPTFSQGFPWGLVFCEVFATGQPLTWRKHIFYNIKIQHSKHFDGLKRQLRTFHYDLPHVKYIYFT